MENLKDRAGDGMVQDFSVVVGGDEFEGGEERGEDTGLDGGEDGSDGTAGG